MCDFFAKERLVAPPDYNRWRVPPAALAVHLCIGQVYAFSVFNLPLTRLLGMTTSAPDDWTLSEVGWIFSLAIVFLGLSAAFAGRWLERVGPRVTMCAAALCFGGGFWLAAWGVIQHQILWLYLGYGVLGGIGLGLGYVSPVSTLLKWFPDRRGLATGLAIMGFGGGALIGSPWAVMLMNHYASPASTGVAETFMTMGSLYGVAMLYGALSIRLPSAEAMQRYAARRAAPRGHVTDRHVHIDQALRTPQFYLLWLVLLLNVSAGIGVLGQASAMIQEMFPTIDAAAAAGFVGLLSVFNMAGRFFWATVSDYLGRRATFTVFFLLGGVLYACTPSIGASGHVWGFVACYAVIISMYGGGFATIPAYLADVFGTRHVGGIHGRLLTAWSLAGVVGPVLVNYLREYQLARGLAPAEAYNMTFYILSALLFCGLLCNALMRPVHDKHYLPHDEVDEEWEEPEQA